MRWKEIDENPRVIAALEKAVAEIQAITAHRVTLVIDSYGIFPSTKFLLAETVAQYFGLSWAQMVNKRSKMYEYDALHVFMYLAVKMMGCSRVETAAYCQRNDHTTVMSAIKKIDGFYDVNDPLCEDIEAIKILMKKEMNEKV